MFSKKLKKYHQKKSASSNTTKLNAHAVIDIGTNTVILLIGKALKTKIKVLHDEAIITRLGEGLTEHHFFQSPAMNRTLDILARYKQTCEKYKIKKIVAVGTASFRTAANTEVFLAKAEEKLGLKIQVITGDEEAEYVFSAAHTDFGNLSEKLLVVDIGGGSTEIITGPLNSKNFIPENLISLALGSVRLTEQHVRSDPISDDEFKRLLVIIRNGLSDELDDFYPHRDFKNYVMVATAGTATTLAALDQQLASYNPQKVHGYKLTKSNLENLVTRLAKMSLHERQKLPGLEPLRADVILAGGLLLNEILRYFGKNEVIISDRGLRFGVFSKKFL